MTGMITALKEKVKAIKENPNNTSRDVQEKIYEMEYNLEMAEATGELSEYTRWMSYVLFLLTSILIFFTAKSYYDGDQSFTLLIMSLTALIASIGVVLKRQDLYLQQIDYLQKYLLTEKKVTIRIE